MSFLLDTNLVSEWIKEDPNPGVIDWLAKVDEAQTFLSVITITELRYGLERMPTGIRKKRLDHWLSIDLVPRFEGKVIPVDLAIADACGKLMARSEGMGRPIEARDALIAATAEVYDLTLVTRNVSDFQPILKAILSPWT
jgi:predicted nucleic acid-binding protein